MDIEGWLFVFLAALWGLSFIFGRLLTRADSSGRRRSLYLATLGLCVGVYGGFRLASLLWSPRIEAVGQVRTLAKSRRSKAYISTYRLRLLVRGEEIGPFGIQESVYKNLKEGDEVRIVYRGWDSDATEVEGLRGTGQRWVWKRGISVQLFWAVLLLLIGIGITAGAGLRDLVSPRRRVAQRSA